MDAPDPTTEQLVELQDELANLPNVTDVEIDYNPARFGSGRTMSVIVHTTGLDEAAIREFYPTVLEPITDVPFEFGGVRSSISDDQTDASLNQGDFEPDLTFYSTRDKVIAFLESAQDAPSTSPTESPAS